MVSTKTAGKPVIYSDPTVEDLTTWLESRKLEELLYVSESRMNSIVHIFLKKISTSEFGKPENVELMSRSAIKQQVHIRVYAPDTPVTGSVYEFGAANGPVIQVMVYGKNFDLRKLALLALPIPD